MEKLSKENYGHLSSVRYINGYCNVCHKPFLIRIEKCEYDKWEMVFAYANNESSKSGSTSSNFEHINGGLSYGEYYSCPHCGHSEAFLCTSCNTMVCHDGQKSFFCHNCGDSGTLGGKISGFQSTRGTISSKKVK